MGVIRLKTVNEHFLGAEMLLNYVESDAERHAEFRHKHVVCRQLQRLLI